MWLNIVNFLSNQQLVVIYFKLSWIILIFIIFRNFQHSPLLPPLYPLFSLQFYCQIHQLSPFLLLQFLHTPKASSLFLLLQSSFRTMERIYWFPPYILYMLASSSYNWSSLEWRQNGCPDQGGGDHKRLNNLHCCFERLTHRQGGRNPTTSDNLQNSVGVYWIEIYLYPLLFLYLKNPF